METQPIEVCLTCIRKAYERGNHAEAIAAVNRAFANREYVEEIITNETSVIVLMRYGCRHRDISILENNGISKIGQLVSKHRTALLLIPNVGEVVVKSIELALSRVGLRLEQ